MTSNSGPGDSSRPAAATRLWVERVVAGLGLCPFAAAVLDGEQLRLTVTEAPTAQALLEALAAELHHLEVSPGTETTLLIHPNALTDFFEYNDFLNTADELIRLENLEGRYQIASFHPAYRFSGTADDDAENYTNRSPYPMLHLLRESRVEQAVGSHPDIDGVPERNISLMQKLGYTEMSRRLEACLTLSSDENAVDV